VVQNAVTRHPSASQVPLLLDFAKTPGQKGVLSLLAAPNRVGRPYMAPPGIPKERLAMLRKAFLETAKDPQFIADTGRLKLAINPVTGDEIESVFKAAAKTDKALIDEMIRARAE
jgi:hypothetical protein